MRKITFLLFFLTARLAMANASFLNDYIMKEWTTADGLPGNSATDIIQTRDGYVYIGTYEGLARFNGIDFTLLHKYSGGNYSFTTARSIFEDSEGNLWVGSNDEGVEKISPGGRTVYTTENGLPNNSVRSLAQDNAGNVWIGTANGLCYVTPDGLVMKLGGEADHALGNNLVLQLFCDSAGRMWILTSNSRGLYFYNGNSLQRYKDLDWLGDFHVTTISQDMFGTLWLGLSYNGIVRISDGEVRRLKTDTIADSIPTWSICHDSSGATWLGTEQGIVLYRDGTFAEFSGSVTYRSNSVNKIIEDREHNIWVATDSAGIEKISSGKFRTNTLDTAVNAIAEGKDGLVWVGGDNGLFCYRKDEPVSNGLTEFCAGLRIRHIEIADNGDVLVNAYTKPAFVRWDGTDIRSWSTDDGLAGDKTRVAIETAGGDVYVGTTTGLSIIRRDGSIRTFRRDNVFETEYIMCLYEDAAGRVWIGTDGGGIYVMQGEEVVDRITSADGLAGNVIFKVIQDAKGIYWICTGTGISRYDESVQPADKTKKLFFNYTLAEGLGTNSVFQMVIDHSNTVWMTSNRGISSVPLDDMDKLAAGKARSMDVKFYTQDDGIRTAGVNSTALSALDRFGRVWFTLTDGFAVYDPVKNQSSGIAPSVHIESVLLDGTEIKDPGQGFVVPAGAKRLDISFTGLSFVAPERLRFKYMLVGFDKDYCQPVQSRMVSYTNLPPGNYRFLVTAMNIDGIWNITPTSLEFRKEPFYYQRPVFWIVLVACGLAAIVLVIVLRERENKARQLQLNTMVQLKTADLEIERDRSERLLRSILPESIAERLKVPGQRTIADHFEQVTVLFADIMNFTKISETESPENIVTALNDLISRFDERAKEMGVEKIKTIGDAYMAACGVPTENPDHAMTMVKFARGMYEDLASYNSGANIKFSIRIGLNSGPVVAGVIGKDKFVYDIWGDTVNIASRMEKLCTPGKIRMTDATRKIIQDRLFASFSLEEDCEVKGKGLMHTYEL